MYQHTNTSPKHALIPKICTSILEMAWAQRDIHKHPLKDLANIQSASGHSHPLWPSNTVYHRTTCFFTPSQAAVPGWSQNASRILLLSSSISTENHGIYMAIIPRNRNKIIESYHHTRSKEKVRPEQTPAQAIDAVSSSGKGSGERG